MLKRLFFPVLVLVALAVGSLSIATAWAGDTFTLVNHSKWPLGGTWFGYQPPCTGGVFSSNGNTYSMSEGQSGSIELERGTISCDPSISISGYGDNGRTWYFNPDDPYFGGASIESCYGEPGLSEITVFSIHGLTCVASEPSSVPAVHFVASAAAVRHGSAFVPVQLYAKQTSGDARIDVDVRDQKGKLRGHAVETIGVGWPRAVQVPVDRALSRQVGKQKHVNVSVIVRRVDGKPGGGDHLPLILRTDHPALHF